jgi:hypothetical protein
MGWATLLAMTDRATLGQLGGPVTYTPASGPSVEVSGIFDAAFVPVDAGGVAVIGTSGPAVFVRLADLPTDPETDNPVITVAGQDYTVREVHPDGTGVAVILLHKAT